MLAASIFFMLCTEADYTVLYILHIYIHTHIHTLALILLCCVLLVSIYLYLFIYQSLFTTYTHTHFTTYFTCRYKDACLYMSCFINTCHISEPISRCHTMLPLPGYLLYIGDYTTQLYWNYTKKHEIRIPSFSPIRISCSCLCQVLVAGSSGAKARGSLKILQGGEGQQEPTGGQ